MSPANWKVLTLLGYFSTFFLLLAWYGFLSPSAHLSTLFILLLLCTPLLLPLRGLLRGDTYTYGWSLFLALGYFIHGVLEAFSTPTDRVYGALEILFTLCWFLGGIAFIRSSARQSRTTATTDSTGDQPR